MLHSLHIRDFVIVDEAEIRFGPGFSVFSGETGAGKSILIDALALCLGARGDAGVLREGASRADIHASFTPPAELNAWLQAHDLDAGGELVLRRVIDAQGRSRAYVNGAPSTLTQLRELGEQLVDIHGQHAHQSLMRSDAQRDLLDTHGELTPLARQTEQAWKHWHSLTRQIERLERDADARQERADQLQWQLDMLHSVNLQPGEWPRLQAEHDRLAHAQALLDGGAQALSLPDDDQGALHLLSGAIGKLNHLLRHDTALTAIRDTLESARIAASDAISELRDYVERMDLDPENLARAEARLSAVFDLSRKLRADPDTLPELQEQLEHEAETLRAANDAEHLKQEEATVRAAYDTLAAQLSAGRRKAANDLSHHVTAAMQTLAMDGGRFEIQLDSAAPGAHGNETIVFQVAGHAGVAPRPLAKVASGGELARISLALSVIASRAARVPTLIFDEVDTGIGGAVAEVVGRLLQELGTRHQVLCVTHLPQVAACGDKHFQVSKSSDGELTRSAIVPLGKQGRIEEIARMLGGITLTDTTRRHAKEMLSRSGTLDPA
ncbi:DNA repair protein RecN [Kerstersia sp.]|uniref:DNA repair protein RecN n=1 Tax=Kerstersia sp. TaxID=1930783 RepID=UPI003F93375D